MKILSLNCRNWNRDTDKTSSAYWKDRMEAMSRMIRDKQPDIICFQEMIAPMGQYVPDGWKRVGISVSHHIYVRKGLKAKNHKFCIHFEQTDIEGIRIFCVHGKWTDKVTDELCDDLSKNVRNVGKAVAMGDFNVPVAALNARNLPTTARQKLGMLEVDTFHHFSKDQHGEIDHAILWGLIPAAYEVITDGYGVPRISDHWPILLTI